MKQEKLLNRIAEIESKRGKADCTYSTETATNEQVRLNKLFIELINDFNEKTNIYNNRLIWLTVVIAILTLLLLIKTFI